MSQAKIYVGNLSYNTTEDQLRDFFSQYGNIDELKLISDFQTGRSKGFGFITYASDDEGKNALEANGQELDGRKLRVNTAKEGGSGGGGGGRRAGAGAGGGQRRQRENYGNR
jgi:RNA recognition motif-containing protein